MSFDVGKVLEGMGPGLLSGVGNAMDSGGGKKPDNAPKAPDPHHPATARPNSFKDGGTVEKTGLALVHKGEKVIPVSDKSDKSGEHGKTDTVHLSHHRVVMHLKKGGLHRALHVPEGETIPQDKIDAARNSKNPHLRAMANLAHTMAGWHKK